jgi:enoyl-CoA hydratase
VANGSRGLTLSTIRHSLIAMTTCFSLNIENAIAHIVLNRHEAFNSMPRAFWNELPALVNDISDNAKARVIVISSTGKFPCSPMAKA